jgi:SAM-dependent methyltransferase
MKNRTRARELAELYHAQGDPTGWFERLYAEAREGKAVVPWADLHPNPNLLEYWEKCPIPATGKRALKVGCGLGDDAEQLAAWGFETIAFDISPSAIQYCLDRFPETRVTYVVADLLHPPGAWTCYFDFVLESYTLQVLPPSLRVQAIPRLVDFLKEGALLLLIARGRHENEPKGLMPWPLTRRELDVLALHPALVNVSLEDYMDHEDPPVRRFRAMYRKATPSS